MTHRSRRPGLSLTEVLVALFVMAIGLIGILTLFPVGAISIGQALRDDRCSETALQADGYLRAYWQSHVVEQVDPTDSLYWALDDPNLLSQQPQPSSMTGADGVVMNTYLDAIFRLPSSAPALLLPQPAGDGPITAFNTGAAPRPPLTLSNDHQYTPADPMMNPPPTDPQFWVTRGARNNGISYPVMIDPLGTLGRTDSSRFWVGINTPTTGQLLLPRRNLQGVTNGNAARICSLSDDKTFQVNGIPPTGDESPQMRYNWSAIIQRPDNTRRKQASLWILVFDGRPVTANEAGSEIVVTQDITAGSASVTVTVPASPNPNAPPIVRRGGWMLEGTLNSSGHREVHFHRIVGLTDNSGGNYTLDIDPPIHESITGATLYFFSGLAEVFERPRLGAVE